jgi:hypothetical protein
VLHGSQEIRADTFLCFLYLARRYPHAAARQIYAIQLLRPGKQRSIAAPPDIRDNLGRDFLGLDVATLARGE